MIGAKQAKTDLGKIKIHVKAIRSIAAIAIMEVEGVLKIYTGTAGKLFEFLGRDRNAAAINVILRENNEVGISASIVVEYGYDLPRVASYVQENIKTAVEKMTGLIPVNIDVKVKSVEKKR